MGRLLKFEFRKLFHSKLPYIFIAIVATTVLFEGLIYFGLDFLLGDIEEVSPVVAIPVGYLFVKGVVGGTFLTLAAVYITIYACEENTQHTTKNIIAKGYNRLKVYFSKYIPSLIVIICLAIVGVIVGAGIGLAAWGPESFANDDNLAVIIIGQLFCLIVYHALYFAIAYTIGKLAGALVINILLASLLGSVFMIIDMALENQGINISQYWVSGILTNFSGTTDKSKYLQSFILLPIYLALFETFGIIFARRKQF